MNPVALRQTALASLAQRYQQSEKRVLEIIKSTCIKPDKNGRQATEDEVAAFLIVANRYGLDPFLKEIHAFVGKGGAINPIVGIDGWAKLVNDHANFDGCSFEEQVDNRGNLVATTCHMYAKDRRHPVSVTEWLAECFRPTEPWKNMPHRMLRHKTFMQAARICFSLSGIFDEDEASDVIRVDQVPPIPPMGRQSLRNGNPPAPVADLPEQGPPLEPPSEPTPPAKAQSAAPADPSPPAAVLSEDDQMALRDFVDNLTEEIRGAELRDLDELRKKIQVGEWMGQGWTLNLLQACEKREQELQAKTHPPAGKRK